MQKKFSLQDVVLVGVMAAIVFVLTYFIKIDIPTPVGPTMLKVANGFCLLAGILLGGLKGGLAAGLGSMLYDLTDPRFIASAPFTFAFFFIMAFLAGIIANHNNADGKKKLPIVIGSVVGALSYTALYLTKSILTKTLEAVGFSGLFSSLGAEAFKTSIIAVAPKAITSLTNGCIGIVVAILLAIPLKTALQRTNIFGKKAAN